MGSPRTSWSRRSWPPAGTADPTPGGLDPRETRPRTFTRQDRRNLSGSRREPAPMPIHRTPSRSLSPTAKTLALCDVLALLTACGSGRPMPLDANPTEPVPEDVTSGDSLFDLTVPGLDGKPVDLERYRGKTVVVVNTATECGFTGQLRDLETIQAEYGPKGVQILAFPSNDFGGQEPLDGSELETACRTQYGASYPILGKVKVKAGDDQSPVYARLQQITEVLPGWNFGKYVMSKDGRRARYFGPMTNPTDAEFRAALDEALR